MKPRELRPLLELMLEPGLGAVRLRELLRRQRDVRAALTLHRREANSRRDIELSPGRDRGRLDRHTEREMRHARIERAMQAIHDLHVHVLTEAHPNYPAALQHLHAPPPVLFARGDLGLLRMRAVAVVGARVHTEYGASTAQLLAGGLARAGLVILSGLARGIDRIAHEAALEAGGRTIAVLGCGIDVTYPPEHAWLQETIGQDHLLLSELLPGEPPIAHHFPRRNRILAALPEGVLVVEAGAKSGALITAHGALELGRSVYAVPGPIGRATSVGPNLLIQDGAVLVLSTEDVLDDLQSRTSGVRSLGAVATECRPPAIADDTSSVVSQGAGRQRPRSRDSAEGSREGGVWLGSPSHAAVLAALGAESAHVDEVASKSGVSATETLVALLELELDGRVRQLPGMRFARGR